MDNILEGEEGVIIHNPGEVKEPIQDDTPSGDPPSGDPPAGNFDPKTYFKEKLGIDYEDDEKFKERYSSLTIAEQRAAELESQIAAKDAERQKLIDEAEDTFKSKYNLNDNEIRRLLILKEYPKSDPELMTKIITRDFSKDIKDNPIDVLIAKVRLDDPDIYEDDASAEERVYEMFNIDLDARKLENGVPSEDEDGNPVYLYKDKDGNITIPPAKTRAMQKAAKDANMSFEEIRNKIPIPDKTDLIAKKEIETKEQKEKNDRLRSQWEPTFKNLANKVLDKIKFERETPDKKQEVFFEFDVDDAFKKEAHKILTETDLNTLISKGIEYSKDAEQKLLEGATEVLQKRYLSKKVVTAMLLAREKQLEKAWADKDHIDSHNPMNGTGRTNPVKITDKLKAKHAAVDEEIDRRLSGKG